MKPNVFHGGWNPFDNEQLELTRRTGISVDVLHCDTTADVKILCIIEPPVVLPHMYTAPKSFYDAFDKIYTYSPELLEMCSNAELLPYGTTWIKYNEMSLDKQDRITFLTSSKDWAEGHKLRLQIYDYLADKPNINGFEIFKHKSPPQYMPREDFFNTAKFHIVAENCRHPNWFTEKVIDCFVSYTIPIYYGCPNIGDFFNRDGIICFETVDQLNDILNSLTPALYDSMLGAAKNNFNLAKAWIDDNHITTRLARNIRKFVNGQD